ncbi:DUF4278 domain-containing protein [Synechococcus sp. Nb3U1]|uniref:DUF4278 domain-containing protein n=1 Tax=Synechococcus sp. Nb3U1 TaxID=1914529 RepID=UPI001F46F189|nr:DUF4278 domain-containing protein [Synechococcus sp. Nb3U1]MCF2970355.1 DUF4278 domain-containing protein [Synechococcus sp. Nb3U1]
MQLTYRGIAYEFVPPSGTWQEQDRIVPYRGLEWNWHSQSAVMVLPDAFALTYRGIALHPAPIATLGIPVAEVAPSTVTSSRKHFMAMLEETHRQNLMHRLQERIRSAQARGDEHLLQQLEHERQLLA